MPIKSSSFSATYEEIILTRLCMASVVRGTAERSETLQYFPEVRLLAEAYLERHPMFPHTIKTMAQIEDEEHLEDFLAKYTTSFDCSARALLFDRYFRLGDTEKFEPERRYQLYQALSTLLCPFYLLKQGESGESGQAGG